MNQIDPELLKRLDALAAKLGVTAEHLWRVLMVQARVQAVTDIALFLLSLVVLVVLARLWRKSLKDWDEGGMIVVIIATIATAALWIASIVGMFDVPGLLFNPEYFALKEILGALAK